MKPQYASVTITHLKKKETRTKSIFISRPLDQEHIKTVLGKHISPEGWEITSVVPLVENLGL